MIGIPVPRRSLFSALVAFVCSWLWGKQLKSDLSSPAVDSLASHRPEPFQVWRISDGRPPYLIHSWRTERQARDFLDEYCEEGGAFAYELRVDHAALAQAEHELQQSDNVQRFLPRHLRDFCEGCSHPANHLTPAMIRTRAARAAFLSGIVDHELRITFSPGSFINAGSEGHIFTVLPAVCDREGILDDREPDIAGQLAAWLREQAEGYIDLAARVEAVKGGAA